MSLIVRGEDEGPSRRRLDVLVTDGTGGQERSALAAVRALAAAGYRPKVTVAGRTSPAAASRHCAGTVSTPAASEPGYAEAVRAELRCGDYLGTMPASDAAARALGAPGGGFLDKEALAERALRAGMRTPPSQRFETTQALLDSAAGLTYPVVVKPTTSRFPAMRATGAGDMQALRGVAGPVLVQPYLTGSMRAVSGVLWDGELLIACHQRYLRTWPVGAGTACAAETVAPDAADEDALLRLLDGYTGLFQAQIVGEHLIDLNPRVYGSLPLAQAAGTNLPGALCDLARGVPVARARAREGVAYRWLEGDLRHLTVQVRRGHMGVADAMRALRPRRGTAHSIESARDPGPMLARVRQAVQHRPERSGP